MDVISTTVKSLLPASIDVNLCSDYSPQQAAIIALHSSILKKYHGGKSTQAADKAALDLFLTSNERCAQWQPDKTSYYYDIMCRAREKLAERLFSGTLQEPVISLAKAFDRLRPGPGSSQGTKFTDFCGKVFNSKLTTYSQALWQYYRENIPLVWKLAERTRELQYGGCSVVPTSRLTYAKKNHDISRVINTEASLDMMYQLGIGSLIEDFLLQVFNINLSKQPNINSALARLGSLYGSHATIDLKSASDLIAKLFVKWFVPARLYQTLDSVRAKCIELPDGRIVELNTFSTMGNGFTFPLQTLIFSCIVEAAYESCRIPTDNSRYPAFSVFGDDIICVSSAYDTVIGLLEWCGFTVNKTKSFNSGGFRESCGKDFFKGHDVRGVYCKDLSDETHIYSLFNRLARWSCRHGVDLSAVLRYLKGLVVFRPVPFDAQDVAGIKVPFEMSGLTCKRGLVRYKQCEYKQRRVKTTKYEQNPTALAIAAIGGYLSGHGSTKVVNGTTGFFVERSRPHGPPRTRIVKRSTSSWDWIPQHGLTTVDYTLCLHEVMSNPPKGVELPRDDSDAQGLSVLLKLDAERNLGTA